MNINNIKIQTPKVQTATIKVKNPVNDDENMNNYNAQYTMNSTLKQITLHSPTSTSNGKNSEISNAETSKMNFMSAEESQESMPLIRPSYFVPGHAQLKTLDDEGIKMMKSGNKILLPRLEGTRGFVVQGSSQVLMQTTNKMTGTGDEIISPKPDYSYASMICQAIFASPVKKSTLSEIYEWISTTYPFFKRNQQAFVRASRAEGATGKGGYWTVDPLYERYFVSGHFKPPGNETKNSYKRARSDENEITPNTNATKLSTHNKNGSAARVKLQRPKNNNIEAEVQLRRGEICSSKKKIKVEGVMESVNKVTETINNDNRAKGSEELKDQEDNKETMIRKFMEGFESVYHRYCNGNDPNWQGDAAFFASFSPFLSCNGHCLIEKMD
ncbi:15237_t:CDS:2 [Funneliformis geosporum]|uniref:4092_t:CDS:1 n=1 Tax=Funneliformis geosporum TaxID=1117311 RepID=A0A9W4SQB5_9GLOM|nr:15237_t:CDS:2 [Funneliformis geosporum]CAI2177765.1 4092_t:CDS:2 [Funneliformis geosporum]